MPAGVVNCVVVVAGPDVAAVDVAASTGAETGAAAEDSTKIDPWSSLTLSIKNLRALGAAASAVADAVHNGALLVVGVEEAVIGIATPICRPVAGAIGATREMAGSLQTLIDVKGSEGHRILLRHWRSNCLGSIELRCDIFR